MTEEGIRVAYWWLNRTQRTRWRDLGEDIIWTPQPTRRREPSWETITELRPEDVVLHYGPDQAVVGINIVTTTVREALRPAEVRAPELPERGWLVKTAYRRASAPIPSTDLLAGPVRPDVFVNRDSSDPRAKGGMLFPLEDQFATWFFDQFGGRFHVAAAVEPEVRDVGAESSESIEIEYESRELPSARGSDATSMYVHEAVREMSLVDRRLRDDYRAWLGRPLKICRYLLPTGETLESNAFDAAENELIEAKCSTARSHVRMALGQLLDLPTIPHALANARPPGPRASQR
jgi:hypothetical protein